MLRNIYFAKFQSSIRYGIILWRREIERAQVKKYKNRVIHSFKGLNKESCRQIFRVEDCQSDHVMHL